MKRSLVFFCGMTLATACLITNCPKGGKRGFYNYLGELAEKASIREIPSQCMKCGPRGDGRCVGPELCCGPQIGCLMGSPGISSECSGFKLLSQIGASNCPMASGIGICTIDGVCCDSESCRVESSCEADPYYSICPDDIIENEIVHL